MLDPLRALAACAVMWYHFTFAGSFLKDVPGPASWLRASGSLGWLGVQVFFVISGFVLPYAMWRGGYRVRDFGTFLRKRLTRLEPPYVFALVMTVGLWILASYVPAFHGPPFRFDWKQFLLHFGYLNAFFDYEWYSPVFWTLGIEFQFYLLIAALFPFVVHERAAVRVALPLACAALGLLPVRETVVFHHLALFALGILTAQYYLGLLSARSYLGLAALVTGAAAAALGSLPAVVGLAAALVVARSRHWHPDGRIVRVLRAPALVWLGTVSYSIYLMHVPVGSRLLGLGGRIASGFAGQLVVLAIAIGGSLFAAAVTYALVERPAQRWSSRVRYRSARPAASGFQGSAAVPVTGWAGLSFFARGATPPPDSGDGSPRAG